MRCQEDPKALTEIQVALLEAVMSGNELLLTLLLRLGADVNCLYRIGNTYLIQEAVSVDNVNILRILLENGAQVNSVNSSGQTAIYLAAALGNLEHVNLLLKYHADPEINDRHGGTILEIVDGQFPEIIEAISAAQNHHQVSSIVAAPNSEEGNCFFEALAKQLRDLCITETHENLRALGVHYILEHQGDFRDTIAGSFDNFIGDVSSLGTWADHQIIRATSLAINRNIIIHRSNGRIESISPELKSAIHLDYTGDHYISPSIIDQSFEDHCMTLPISTDSLSDNNILQQTGHVAALIPNNSLDTGIQSQESLHVETDHYSVLSLLGAFLCASCKVHPY